jgi:hypothetical protein
LKIFGRMMRRWRRRRADLAASSSTLVKCWGLGDGSRWNSFIDLLCHVVAGADRVIPGIVLQGRLPAAAWHDLFCQMKAIKSVDLPLILIAYTWIDVRVDLKYLSVYLLNFLSCRLAQSLCVATAL